MGLPTCIAIMLYYPINEVHMCFFGAYNKLEPTVLLNLPITLSRVSQKFNQLFSIFTESHPIFLLM